MLTPAMNEAKKDTIWSLWTKGEPMIQIARAIDKPPATIFSYLRYHGGIQPYKQIRAESALSLDEREEVSRGLAANKSLRMIAELLGRSPSTISREVSKNGGRRRYRATEADAAAWKRAKRPKPCLLAKNVVLKDTVTSKLTDNWSPEQISGWLKIVYSDNDSMHVPHETIYKSLFIQTPMQQYYSPTLYACAQAVQAVQAGLAGFCVSATFLTMGFTWPIYILLALAIALSEQTKNNQLTK